MRKTAIVLVPMAIGALAVGMLRRAPTVTSAPATAPRWETVCEGPVEDASADVMGSRVRLRIGTRGTPPETVSRVVARPSVSAVRRVSAVLDWNHQENGCFLSAGIVLGPVRVEYVGVPPGRNARLAISLDGRPIYMEGWPEFHREGRLIGRQHIEIALEGGQVEVRENGVRVFAARCGLERAPIEFELTSHSNFPVREVYFDEVRLE